MSGAMHSGSIPHDIRQCWGRQWIVGTPEQFRWLYGLLQVVLILNVLDAVMTLFWVGTGLAQEANAFLQMIVNDHPLAFMIAKTALVSCGGWLLWQRRFHPLAVIGLVAVFMVYYSLFLHHLQFASWAVAILMF